MKIVNEKFYLLGILVNLIDFIKGLEGEKCLFIVIIEIVEYLFGIKKD